MIDETLPSEKNDNSPVSVDPNDLITTGPRALRGRSMSSVMQELTKSIESKATLKNQSKVDLMLLALHEIKELKLSMDRKRYDANGRRLDVDLSNQSRKWLASIQFLYDALDNLEAVKFEQEDLRQIASYLLKVFKDILEKEFEFSDSQMDRFVSTLRKRSTEIDNYIALVASRKNNPNHK